MALFEGYFISAGLATSLKPADMWFGQTFTPQLKHSIEYVNLSLKRYLNPGNLVVKICSVDVNSNPIITTVLTSATFITTSISTSSYESVAITFNAPILLSVGKMYALVWNLPYSDINNYLKCERTGNTDSYIRGQRYYSDDNGTTWYPSAHSDFLFEEYGTLNTKSKLPDLPGLPTLQSNT